MGLFDLLQFFIIALYALGAGLFIHGFACGVDKTKSAGTWVSVAGFVLHSLDLLYFLNISKAEALSTGQFYFSLLAWSLLLIYFLLWWRLRLSFLGLTAAPLALILFISSLAIGSLKVLMPAKMSALFFGLHIGSLFLSMGFMAMAFGAAIAFLRLDSQIKHKSGLKSLGKSMPSLSAFDKVNFWAIMLGFPLYTIGLFSGFVWARITWGKYFTWDPKELAALIVWFLFAFLLHQRLAMGWRGKKTAKLVIWIFAISLISLVGINFLTSTHHSFKPNP